MGFDVKTRVSKLIASAKARGIHVNLCGNKYQELINNGCHYCGSSLEKEKGYCLDRVDTSKGYTISNVVACCKICNYAKRNIDIWTFANWLIKAGKHTEKVIKMVKDGEKAGDYYDPKEEHAVYARLHKDKEKFRIKFVPTAED